MSNSMTVSKISVFFVSTAWSCVYLQKIATEIRSSKINLPKYFETYKNRCFLTYPDFGEVKKTHETRRVRVADEYDVKNLVGKAHACRLDVIFFSFV